MDLLKKLQNIRDGIKPTVVTTKTIGEVEILPMFMTERLEFMRNASATNQKDFVMLLIAMSLSDKGQRLSDSMDIDEIIAMLDPLGCTDDGISDINTLYEQANSLSKITQKDVEDAQKN